MEKFIHTPDKKKIRIRVVSQIPFYAMLIDYTWVDGFVELEASVKKLAELHSKPSEISNKEASKDVLLKLWKKSLDEYNLTRQHQIQIAIKENKICVSAAVIQFQVRSLPPYINWMEIEKAAESVDFSGGISDEQRQKEIDAVNQEITAVKAKISDLTPPEYFYIKDGAVKWDVRQRFVDYWRELQLQADAPLCPHGGLLPEADEAVKTAWGKLVGIDYVDSTAEFAPNTLKD
jgi:hypothetical protein